MKIRKNGKVINLTESDLRRIVKRVINEQSPRPHYDDDNGLPWDEFYNDQGVPVPGGLNWDEESGVFTLSSSDPYEYKVYVNNTTVNPKYPKVEIIYYTRHKRRNAPMGADFRWKDMEKTLSPQNFKIAKEKIDNYVFDNKRDFSRFILDAILGRPKIY